MYVAFDVLYRYLQHLGYDVTYVRNFTGRAGSLLLRAHLDEVLPGQEQAWDQVSPVADWSAGCASIQDKMRCPSSCRRG